MSFKEDALVACGRRCCLCHKFCGLKIELHHIDQKAEGGLDTYDNCIPLCLDCHADMRSYDHKHPKGTKYTPSELRRHRDGWYSKVSSSPGSAYTAASAEMDRQIYVDIVKLLPYPTVMNLIETHDFGGSFQSRIFGLLDEFLRRSEDPNMEFLDSDLEGTRVTLVNNIHEFVHYLAHHTWRTDKEWQSVPPEWQHEQPKRYDQVVDRINELSLKASASYRMLVREARQRLGVQLPTDAA
jgi:HNH endonuclease